MKAVIRVFIVLSILMQGFTNPACAANIRVTHTGHFEVRRPTNDKISKYQSDRNFKYETNKHERLNLWQRFMEWLSRRFMPKDINGGYKSGNIVWTIFELLLIAAAITLFIYFILKGQGVSLFSKNNGTNLGFIETHEDLTKMNFDELIAKAAGSGQYRQAVRYLYLKSLKQLSDMDMIKWKADKTNRDYTIELRSSPFSKLFSEITMLFDYAWYGNAAINDATFARIKSVFEQFNINTGQRT